MEFGFVLLQDSAVQKNNIKPHSFIQCKEKENGNSKINSLIWRELGCNWLMSNCNWAFLYKSMVTMGFATLFCSNFSWTQFQDSYLFTKWILAWFNFSHFRWLRRKSWKITETLGFLFYEGWGFCILPWTFLPLKLKLHNLQGLKKVLLTLMLT